jgi:hypothetical protein
VKSCACSRTIYKGLVVDGSEFARILVLCVKAVVNVMKGASRIAGFEKSVSKSGLFVFAETLVQPRRKGAIQYYTTVATWWSASQYRAPSIQPTHLGHATHRTSSAAHFNQSGLSFTLPPPHVFRFPFSFSLSLSWHQKHLPGNFCSFQ